MAEFKISRLRYYWKGTWTTGTSYNRDDIVRYGANSYICLLHHTAQSNFNNDLTYIPPGETLATPRWEKMTDGFIWRDGWNPNTLYNLGDIIHYGGTIYLCTTSYTSTAIFEDGLTNLTLYVAAYEWNTDWTTNTAYGVGDVVKYGGIVYKCTTGHSSAGTELAGLEADLANWEIVHSGVEYRGDWSNANRYRLNDLVKYGATVFRCINGHQAATTFTDSKWQIEFPGGEFNNDWSSTVAYNIGDIVRHGGYLYYSKTNNTNKTPGEVTQGINTTHWAILSKGIRFVGEWQRTTAYRTGDLVRRGGQLYVALQDTTSELLDTLGAVISADGSSLDYLDNNNWELVVPGDNWKNYWRENINYAVGDIVTFEGDAYRCTYQHDSSVQNYPGDNGHGYNYWELMLLSGPNTGLSAGGDLLTYNLSRSLTNDGSTFGVTNVPVGDVDQLLSVDGQDTLYYKVWGNVNRVFYVAPHGVDDDTDPNRGINIFKPYKTIRFACEMADKTNQPQYQTTIKVYVGVYEEVLPIIVPARTAIRGDEVRSVTVKPKPAIAALANDVLYTKSAISWIAGLVPSLLVQSPVSKSTGNNLDQVFRTEIVNEAEVPVVSTPEAINEILDLASTISQYIDFHINSAGTEPTLTGSNSTTTEAGKVNAATILLDNVDFLAAEASAYISNLAPSYQFDSDSCKRDMKRYVEAWAYDILRGGNYKSILAGRYYRNAVLGSEGEDMFYVRDATGIRNMTLSGLQGELSPPNIFDQYRRPTGGVYVSLDPGWGPDDESVWITTRSCYVQNVATFGYGVTGQKIDGALHNGGNRSIVSNDFTQVISDGIGAHVLNNGRAELVSVFTYYSQVGYLAENGGKIRATNGNNSYGKYGALSVGVDPSEVPMTGNIDTRTGDAIVADAFAGEVNDEIQILEFTNAGQNYTQATYTFIGSGSAASVTQREFRDGGVFNVLITEGDSGRQGGGGYSLIGNNAQQGDTVSVYLATNDENEVSNVLGLRCIITSGTGTGQYGYVTGLDTISKQLFVSRESDGQPGWDHVIGGWPIAPALDTSSTYRLEPRVEFTEPPFSSQENDMQAGTFWANVVWGETTAVFDDVYGNTGTGAIETQDGLAPTAARFNVTKNGRTYSATMTNSGIGYAVGDEIVISGVDLGGQTPDNDLIITVTDVSDDSSNYIVDFTFRGIGTSGAFVATAGTGNTTAYSYNGTTWELSTIAAGGSGEWSALAAGENRFVTVRKNSGTAAYSLDGINWTTRSIASRTWEAMAYGDGVFLTIASDSNSASYSINGGQTWTTTTLPTFGDSTLNEWIDVAFGNGQFVVLANSNNIVANGVYNSATNTWAWDAHVMDVVADSSQKDWVSISYGNNRFVAVSTTGDVSYSFDGGVWYPGTMPTQDGSTVMKWNSINFAQGVFVALCDTGGAIIGGDATSGPTNFIATSPDGLYWTGRNVSSTASWLEAAGGNPDVNAGDSSVGHPEPVWVLIPSEQSQYGNTVRVGARAQGRVVVTSGRIDQIKLWDVGSGYTSEPTITLTDPNNTSDAAFKARVGDGVLAQPSWNFRGIGYKTSTTRVTVSGDGFADVFPVGTTLTVNNMERYPGPGAQITIAGITRTNFNVVTITELGENINGTKNARFRISPALEITDSIDHDQGVTIRERYSQCRITGHDFLDIGTGNFLETNYPELYSTGLFTSAPEDEIVEQDGGRVFYTSTDQSGNFRCGELFSVEQATGTVTLSADFFQLEGLTELALGGVRLGGSGAVVREFSTDPLFTADSNNIVPTQRAIKAYLQNRLSVGGAELTTASFIAGLVKVGPDLINTTIGVQIDVPVKVVFDGTAQISGSILAQDMFFASFNDEPSIKLFGQQRV